MAGDKLPAKVKVGYRDYAIEELSTLEADQRRITGETAHLMSLIRVNLASGPHAAAEVLLHEIMHCVWAVWHMESPIEHEAAVTKMAMGLATVWRDNPEVFAWIGRNLQAGT